MTYLNQRAYHQCLKINRTLGAAKRPFYPSTFSEGSQRAELMTAWMKGRGETGFHEENALSGKQLSLKF